MKNRRARRRHVSWARWGLEEDSATVIVGRALVDGLTGELALVRFLAFTHDRDVTARVSKANKDIKY